MRARAVSGWLLVLMLAAQSACAWLPQPWEGASSSRAGDLRPGFNLFSPEQDIELGKLSAEEVTRQVRLVTDERTLSYVRRLGARLAANARGYDFPYKFFVVSTREVNAFALPGGYVFVNAGAIEAARSEGELAGVLAHEIAHVSLRHGTNQASKAYLTKAGLGVLEVVAGGRETELGRMVGAGADKLFLKFGREAETQADLEGARLMAAAGYDPRDMASFFERLRERGGERAQEMMSDHPHPAERVAAISEAAARLRVVRAPARDAEEFRRVKSRVAGGAAFASGSSALSLDPEAE